MAFQTDAFQNFDTHGDKGFQSSVGGGAGSTASAVLFHHYHAAWLLAVLVDLWARVAR